MNPSDIENLLEKGNQVRSPVLTHGTSLEAVHMMLSSGFLPSSHHKGRSAHPSDNGYLFFIPNKAAFYNHSLFNVINTFWDARDMEYEAAQYAEEKQRDLTMKKKSDQMGFVWDPDFSSMAIFTDDIIDSEPPPKNTLAYYLNSLPDKDMEAIKNQLLERRGIVLGINSRIFDFRIERGSDDPLHEVQIYLPKGLAIDYVDYIKPIGNYSINDFL